MKIKIPVWQVLSLLLCAGCASEHHEQTAVYSPLDPSLISPTSDRDQNRIYSNSGTASPEDLQLGRQVRDLLMSDKKLAAPPSSVIASVHQGVVTLQGTVAGPADKRKLVETNSCPARRKPRGGSARSTLVPP